MRVLALIPLLLVGCVQDSVEPLSVPLQYKMMADVTEFSMLPDCAEVSSVVVVDLRDDPVLGDRAIEGQEDSTVPVTTASDVSEWVRTGVEDVLRTGGVSLGRSGAPVLRIEV